MSSRAPWVLVVLLPFLVEAATPPAGPVDASETAAVPSAPKAITPGVGRATTRGGSMAIRWNDDLLLTLGVERREPGGGKAASDRAVFTLDDATRFELDGHRRALFALAAGEGGFVGGYDFVVGDRVVRWRSPSMLARPGVAARIDLQGKDGSNLFYIDTLMHEFVDDGSSYHIRSADIRISADFARLIGRPDAADWAVGEVKGRLPVAHWVGGAVPKAPGDPNWPGEQVAGQPPGTVYRADVFMQAISVQLMRCGNCTFGANGALAACTAVASCATASHLVYAPNSTLINNVANGTLAVTVNNNGTGGACPTPADPATCLGVSAARHAADVPWWEKFTSSPAGPNFQYPFPLNDVHPNLIWNLYRLDAVGADPAGRIVQVGRSGVKHAFLTTNSGTGCDTSNGNHVLGRACVDTYGTGNNDASGDLGPRSELVPAKGLWAVADRSSTRNATSPRMAAPRASSTSACWCRPRV